MAACNSLPLSSLVQKSVEGTYLPGRKERAAQMLAEDSLTDAQISKEIGISDAALY